MQEVEELKELSLSELFEDSQQLVPTAEQAAILEAAKALPSGSGLMIEAMAGCSKTSTIEILIRALPPKPCCYIVFNKRNKDEAEKRFKSNNSPWSHLGSASHCNVVTLNGLGHSAWSKAIGRRLTLNTNKLGNILKQKLQDEKQRDFGKDHFINTLALVRRARIVGLIPSSLLKKGLLNDTEDSWRSLQQALWLDDLPEEVFYYARQVLIESIRQSYQGLIDFDDQIYMSALFGGVFPRYPRVYGDEVQDYTPLNKRQINFTAAGDVILVGDQRQGIYAFRGADSDSINSLRSLRKVWTDLPLSTTFRCPKAVVQRQQPHAPGFTAYHTNAEGLIHDWTNKLWSIKDIKDAKGPIAILCRNNAPLFAAALKILKSGRGCVILGSEIGRGLIALIKKLDAETTQDFIPKLNDWKTEETSKALANQNEAKAALIADKAECLRAIIDNSSARSALDLQQILETLFLPSNCNITLSTGHKAKGLEWPTVIHLDPWRIPSKYALKQLASGDSTSYRQDLNLKYVIETRAQETLILANKDEMQ